MQPDYSEELVERSLDSAESFANAVMPLLQIAFGFSANQVRLTPPGGATVDSASLQLLPNALRANLIKLVEGHNQSGAPAKLRRRGSPNNGLWLGLADSDLEARVYKVSKKHAVRPSGVFQERLVCQERYRDLLIQPGLYGDEAPSLDALLMWQSQGFELTGAYLLIPNGWGDDGRLISLGRRELELPDELSDVATFPTVEDQTTLVPSGELSIFMPEMDAAQMDDRSLLDEEDDLSPVENDRQVEGE